MPDISKIKLENDIYNIKDATARAGLESVESSIQSIETITQAEVDQITNDAFDSFPSPVYGYDTVTDMQADPDLQEGMICHTSGFHKANDGSAAYYKVSSTGTANGMDVLALQNGLLATLVITELYVTPEQFGAYGDGTTDDIVAVQSCIDYATANGYDVRFSVGKTYFVSVGITIGSVNVFMDSPILYKGTGAAITIGNNTTSIARRTYKIWATSNKTEYTSGSVGLQVYNTTNCNINVHIISGFERGVIFSGYNAGFGYNQISMNQVLNCMYSVTLRSDGTSGWCNENYFYNGRLGVESSASYKNSFIGITIDSDSGYLANANTFSNVSIEAAAICIHVVYGAFNSFNRIRSEAAALVFKDENSSNWNYVNVSYGTTAAETVGPMDVVEGYLRNYQAFSMPVFDSEFLPSKSFSNDSYLWLGKDIAFMDANGVLRQVYKGVKYNDHLHITSRNMGVMVDTTNAKRFNVTAMPYNNLGWRVFVVCYDADGNYIDAGVKSNSNRAFGLSRGATISGVTCWVTGNTATGVSFFEVPDSCVRAFIGIIAATDICGFKILSDTPTNAIMGNQVANGLTSIPTCEGKAGDFCPSSAADSTVGWLYNGTEWVAIS